MTSYELAMDRLNRGLYVGLVPGTSDGQPVVFQSSAPLRMPDLSFAMHPKLAVRLAFMYGYLTRTRRCATEAGVKVLA